MKAIHVLNTNRPKTGDKKLFFGKIFIYSGQSWGLDEICKTFRPVNELNKGYLIHVN